MTRPIKSARGLSLSDLFAADNDAAVLRVLEKAAGPLTASEVKQALQAGGVTKADADRAWPGIQKRIRSHDRVVVDGNRYGWKLLAEDVSVPQALDLIAKGGLSAADKAALVAMVHAALAVPPPDLETAARDRQSEIDAVRALAELAIEVEELTANRASADAMVHRVRARVKRTGLEPIDRAGEETTFDRKRHKPVGRQIRDGATVVVVRPGYVWKAPAEDVLIAKAVVEE